MSQRGTIQLLVDELTWLLKIALENVRSPEAFVGWMKRLDCDFALPQLQDLANTVEALDGAIDGAKQLDFERPIEDQSDVFLDISSNLISAFRSARDLPDQLGNLADPQVSDLTDLASAAAQDLVASYFERRLPGTYGVFRVFGIIEKADGKNRRELKFERIGKLVTAPDELALELYGWNDPARFDSPPKPFRYNDLAARLSELGRLLGIPARLEAPKGIPLVVMAESGATRMADVERETAMAQESALRIPIYEARDPNVGYADLGLMFGPALDSDGLASGLSLLVYANGAVAPELDLPGPLFLIPSVEADAALGVGMIPSGTEIELTAAAAAEARFGLALKVSEPGSKILLVGDVGASRFEIAGIELALALDLSTEGDPEFNIDVRLDEGAIIVAPGSGDGFLTKVLPPDGFTAAFSFLLGWSSKDSLYFSGSVGLEVTIPVQLNVGPIEIQSIYLSVTLVIPGDTADPSVQSGDADDIEIQAVLAITASLEIGPLAASVEEIGVIVSTPLPPEGFDDFSFGFKPPKGVGISVEAGPVEGGGYLFIDTENERYAGILNLHFGEIGITAIGLITTRMPDGSKGFSALGIINVLFDPGITLSFGFFLGGIGGYVGIHRQMITEEVQQSARDGSMDSILFPPDPIKNAPKIISDLRRIFPPARGKYLLGVGVRVTWGQPALVVIDLAVIIEIPSPIKIALFGRLAAILPDEKAELLKLKFLLAGIFDEEKKILSIDAGLFESHLLQFPLTGSMALRSRWGDDPMFIMAVGGFDEGFTPPPDFPTLQKMGMSIGASKNPKLTFGGYFALTSNTVQFGARIDVYVKAGPLSVKGFLEFAALFQFSPFYMRARMTGALSVMSGKERLLGVDLDLFLDGPTPWHAKGDAHFKILFVEISASFDETFGKTKKLVYPPQDPWGAVLAELKDPQRWQPIGGAIETIAASGANAETMENPSSPKEYLLVVPPLGALEVRQKVLPFGIRIDKVGNVKTPRPMVFELVPHASTNEETREAMSELRDHFAPTQFRKSSAAEQRGSKAFELYPNGMRISPVNKVLSPSVCVPVVYETRTLGCKCDDGSRPASLKSRELATAREALRHIVQRANQYQMSSLGRATFAIPGQGPLRHKGGGYAVANPATRVIKKNGFATRAEADLHLSRLTNTTDDKLRVFTTAEVGA